MGTAFEMAKLQSQSIGASWLNLEQKNKRTSRPFHSLDLSLSDKKLLSAVRYALEIDSETSHVLPAQSSLTAAVSLDSLLPSNLNKKQTVCLPLSRFPTLVLDRPKWTAAE